MAGGDKKRTRKDLKADTQQLEPWGTVMTGVLTGVVVGSLLLNLALAVFFRKITLRRITFHPDMVERIEWSGTAFMLVTRKHIHYISIGNQPPTHKEIPDHARR